MSETKSEESIPKWPGFDVQVPNVKPAAEGQEVGLSHMDVNGLELLLEIEMEGKHYLVLVDSGASLSVMKPGISSSKVQRTLTAAKRITGKKLSDRNPNYHFSGGKQDFRTWVLNCTVGSGLQWNFRCRYFEKNVGEGQFADQHLSPWTD
jgi:hypothetical protein